MHRLINWIFRNEDPLNRTSTQIREQFFSRTLASLVRLLGFTDRETASQATAKTIHEAKAKIFRTQITDDSDLPDDLRTRALNRKAQSEFFGGASYGARIRAVQKDLDKGARLASS